MTIQKILSEIDAEIARLSKVRALLSTGKTKKTGETKKSATAAAPGRKKYRMSAAGRKKIAAGQRARWARQRAATSK